jgi:hypothetical protein
MGVIIDDFEVVAETPAPAGEAAPPAPSTPPPSQGPSPEDVRHIVSLRDQRLARLFAH